MKDYKPIFKAVLMILCCGLLITSCDENRNKATINGTKDTTSVNKGGGPPIRDTVTINKDRSDSANMPAKERNDSKGNADPSGHMNTKPEKQ